MKIFCQNWSTYKTAPNCPLSANLQHKLLRLLHEIELGTIVMWLQLSWLQHMVTWYLFPHALCMLDVTYFEYVGSVISPADYVVVSTFFHRRKPTLKCFPLLQLHELFTSIATQDQQEQKCRPSFRFTSSVENLGRVLCTLRNVCRDRKVAGVNSQLYKQKSVKVFGRYESIILFVSELWQFNVILRFSG